MFVFSGEESVPGYQGTKYRHFQQALQLKTKLEGQGYTIEQVKEMVGDLHLWETRDSHDALQLKAELESKGYTMQEEGYVQKALEVGAELESKGHTRKELEEMLENLRVWDTMWDLDQAMDDLIAVTEGEYSISLQRKNILTEDFIIAAQAHGEFEDWI